MDRVYVINRLATPPRIIDVIDYKAWITSSNETKLAYYRCLLTLPENGVGWSRDKGWLSRNGYT